MTTELLEGGPASQPPADPFYIGYRYLHTRNSAGEITHSEKVPLTEEDFLHPQFEDKWMLSNPHNRAIFAIHNALVDIEERRDGVRVFTDHRVDWQHPGILPHGPDVVLFENFPSDWEDDPDVGTIFVEDLGAKVLAVFEVTSRATRHVDFGSKFDEYAEVGIPYLIIVDLAAPNGGPRILGFRLYRQQYREMRCDPKLGYFLPDAKLWFRLDGVKVLVADEDGIDIPSRPQLIERIDKAEGEREIEKLRSESEKDRADKAEAVAKAEKAKAAAAESRAEALARELESLRARLPSN